MFGIPHAFIVHCGKQLVEMDPTELQHRVELLAGDAVDAVVTHDGMRVRLHARAGGEDPVKTREQENRALFRRSSRRRHTVKA
jgi:hypothetical protein